MMAAIMAKPRETRSQQHTNLGPPPFADLKGFSGSGARFRPVVSSMLSVGML